MMRHTSWLLVPVLIFTVLWTAVKGWDVRPWTVFTPTSRRHQQQPHHSSPRRRRFLQSSFLLVPIQSLSIIIDNSAVANIASAAIWPGQEPSNNRRQKELCLVNLLRLQYWAINVADKLGDTRDTPTSSTNASSTSNSSIVDEDQTTTKSAYLEARLGAKVIVASQNKVGGGAGANVFLLKSLQIKECLNDLKEYLNRGSMERKQAIEYTDDLLEALASIVEFDGLETTQDPSPRSSLTLGMYTAQKGEYVRRMLSERIVPLTQSILHLFGPDAIVQTESYVKELYPREIPERFDVAPSSVSEPADMATAAVASNK